MRPVTSEPWPRATPLEKSIAPTITAIRTDIAES
jgi:hypothetical protein